MGVLFALPWIIGFLVFQLYPILASVYYSFTSYNLFSSPEWIGLENFREMFADDKFYKSMFNTLYMTVFGVPLGLFFALLRGVSAQYRVPPPAVVQGSRLPAYHRADCGGDLSLAMDLERPVRLLELRPCIIGVARTALDRGRAMDKAGAADHRALGCWRNHNHLLGCTQGSASFLLRSCEDRWRRSVEPIWNITWPAISPVTLFQLVIGVLGSLQYFTQAYLFSQERLNTASGGPEDSLLMYGMYIFHNAFVYLDMGYASALSWMLFIASMAVTAVILLFARKWVHYEGD